MTVRGVIKAGGLLLEYLHDRKGSDEGWSVCIRGLHSPELSLTHSKLEQQLQTKQFSATEERRLQLEIDSLKKSKERLK